MKISKLIIFASLLPFLGGSALANVSFTSTEQCLVKYSQVSQAGQLEVKAERECVYDSGGALGTQFTGLPVLRIAKDDLTASIALIESRSGEISSISISDFASLAKQLHQTQELGFDLQTTDDRPYVHEQIKWALAALIDVKASEIDLEVQMLPREKNLAHSVLIRQKVES